MSRRVIFTTAGIILSILIAIGGWILTNRLINMESERLLSGTTSFSVDIPVFDSLLMGDDDDNDPDANFFLSEHEIISIVRNWEALHQWEPIVQRRLHEPAPGQIDMPHAIESARAGLVFLYDYKILPAYVIEFNDVRAYLGQNISHNEEFLPLEYSYWNIRFFNDYAEILMTINAVTGQVWRIEINTSRAAGNGRTRPFAMELNNNEIQAALAAFMYNSGIGFHDDDVFGSAWGVHDTELIAEQAWLMPIFVMPQIGHRFADNEGAAIISTTGIITEDEVLYFNRFIIALTASVSHEYITNTFEVDFTT